MGRRARRRGIRPPEAASAPVSASERPDGGFPRVALLAPVGNDRDEILREGWIPCIRQQTVQPVAYCFVLSRGGDAVRSILQAALGSAATFDQTRLPFFPRAERNGDRSDPCRAEHFSELRNRGRALALQTDADVVLSLDTDILLEDPTAIERLVSTLYGPRLENPRAEFAWDVVAPLTYLHPNGERSECYNAGRWVAGEPGDPRRVWERMTINDVASRRSPVPIGVPMACYAIRRHAMGMCKYKAFESGEDLGFADSLSQHGFRCAWLTDLRVPHIWDESALRAREEAMA